MLQNLKAEMARYGVQVAQIATAIGKSERTVRDKIDGRYEFTYPEALSIRNKCFPEIRMEYLFAEDSSEK